ncbi:MAG: hypothetical protein ACOH2D_12210 [Gelidibacter sp.]
MKDYVGFERGPVAMTVTENGTSTMDVAVYSSDISSKDRIYNLIVDTQATKLKSAYKVPATVTIPANTNKGTFTVSVTDDETLKYVNQALVVDFERKGGLYFGDKLTINVTEFCTETLVRLALTFDGYPDETTVELFDLSGEEPVVIYEGGPFDGQKNAILSFCLASGKYGVAVYDSYGDGGATYVITSGSKTYVPKTTSKSATSTAEFTIQ